MSGGAFEYKQYVFNEIADQIERAINRSGKEIPKDERWCDESYYDKYPEEKYYHTFSPEVLDEMKNAVKAIRIAGVYVQRFDWYLSGDDSEESFLTRLKKDLEKL